MADGSRWLQIGLAALSLALAGCGGQAGEQAVADDDGRFRVVATHSILGDVVGNVVGTEATVETVMPLGADPHEFEPSAQQIELAYSADLLVVNGLGFEEGLLEVIEAAEADGVGVLSLGEQLDPIPLEGEEGAGDPHWFQDPDRVAEAARLVGARLGELDDGLSAQEWSARADEYATSLEELARQIESALGRVPEAQRTLVTNHDAFGYFADRFGFEIVGTVIPSGTTLAEPSAADLEELADTIEQEGVTAVFAENTQPEQLAETLVNEVDVEVEVVELYSDSLGEEGSEAGTYADMMRANAERITEALAG